MGKREERVVIVPARTGSIGMPNKNFLPFAGSSLVKLAILQGLRVAERVIVTSDADPSLFETPDLEGVIFHHRPAEIAQSSSTMDEVLKDVVVAQQFNRETLILLQPTSPLRNDEVILKACYLFEAGGFDLILSVKETENSILKYGLANGLTFQPINKLDYCFKNRQELPRVLAPNGAVYVFSAEQIKNHGTLACKNIGFVLMDISASIDIDCEADFELCETIYLAQQELEK